MKHAAPRSPKVSLPSAPVLLGVAALSISATGAVSAAASDETTPTSGSMAAPVSALTGTDVVDASSAESQREELVSRDSARAAIATATAEKLEQAAEEQAAERTAELSKLADAAKDQAAVLEENRWQLPLAKGTYRISEGFGQGVEWRGYAHSGLDFAAPMGTPVHAVASGIIKNAQYAGGCGNMIIQVLDDGTELKYCHNSSLAVSAGAEVKAGAVIAYVGSTGHSTGPHVHLEVHPGGGDAVDPYAALVAHGVQP